MVAEGTARSKSAAEQWHAIAGLLEETAGKHGLWFRELPPKVLGDAALCSIITARKQLSLILNPDGELRIIFKALPSVESAVCNILDVQHGYVRQLAGRFP